MRKLNPISLLRSFAVIICAISCFALSNSLAATPDVYDMVVDGVKVIVQPTKANQIIAVNLSISGGYGRGESENPAIPAIAAPLSTLSGTAKYPKDIYRAELSRLVTSIGGAAGMYGATYTLTCVRPKFDESWNIFQDVIREPKFDNDELSKLKVQTLAEIEGRRTEPEGWTNFLLDSIWSAGHRAGRILEPADLASVTTEQLAAFHANELQRSRMLIAIVGDVSRDEVTAKVHSLLAGIPQGNFQKSPYEIISGPSTTAIVSEQRVLPTTYIVGRFVGPPKTDPATWPMRLAISILSDRLYEQVRTKRNLSYSPYAFFGGSMGEYFGQIGVATTDPDSAMHVITRELIRMRDSGVTAKELRDTKESAVTQIYMSQQSNLGEATRLYTAELEWGDYHYALRTVEMMNSVTEDQIKQAVGKYLHNIYWTAVGDQSKLVNSDFVFP